MSQVKKTCKKCINQKDFEQNIVDKKPSEFTDIFLKYNFSFLCFSTVTHNLLKNVLLQVTERKNAIIWGEKGKTSITNNLKTLRYLTTNRQVASRFQC